MAPMSPTFHVQLFSTPISDAPDQQSYHRLGPTQKLETLFLDLTKTADIISPAPAVISPRTRATRRKCQVFDFWTSSTGSIGSHCGSAESNVESHLPSPSPSSSSTLSPRSNLVVKGNSNSGSGKSAKVKAGDRMKPIKSEGPQSLAQPFLLQLRSLPVPPTCTIKTEIPPVEKPKLPPSASSFNMDTTITTLPAPPNVLTDEEMHRNLDKLALSSFNMDTTVTTPPAPRNALTDDEMRRKLAKLASIFGEEIPKDVFSSSLPVPSKDVFWSPPPNPVQRTTSMSNPRSRSKKLTASHKPFASLTVAPPLSVAETPIQPTENPLKQQGRPRSMTLVASPSMTTPSNRGASSTDTLPANDTPFQTIITVNAGTTIRHEGPSQWGRRKEKKWSGEWNVEDMERVAKALRGLKAR